MWEWAGSPSGCPKKDAPAAPRKKQYAKSDLDCDPDIYGEDDDQEDVDES